MLQHDNEENFIPTNPEHGLTNEEVLKKIEVGLVNTSVEAPSKSIGQIISSNIFTYFNFIFSVLALFLILVGAFRELTFMIIIILNTLIGIVQEIRSKRVIDKLSVLNAPRSQVLRDGEIISIESEKLVEGDIVIFESGNQICADAVVIDGEVSTNESLLTGESDEIKKIPGKNLMSGSFVVSGRCKAQLVKVGKESYVSKLILEAKTNKKTERSEMIRSLTKLIKIIGVAIIPIGIIMFCEHYYSLGESLRDSVVAVVAALVGMIPEGLFLLTSIAMVLSVMRLAQKNVLVHELSCIETLARVDVLCVDKTGTITEPVMNVDFVIPYCDYDEHSLNILIGDFAANMYGDNATIDAIKCHFTENSGVKADFISSFSSTTKYSAAIISGKSYVLGAPEFVLRDKYEAYKTEIEKHSSTGSRVLVFGLYDGDIDGSALTENVDILCLILVSNPIRSTAAETFRYFDEQGVEIKVISGDNALTVSEVAKRAGIKNADKYIDASTLKTEADIADAVLKYNVFGRVSPEQKKQFVTALKNAGKTVAMTGDGVNDVLALKIADCSIAMASGSDAAAHVSQLVLLDSDFSRMPSVVLEGRRVVNNIERSASLFLVKNIFSIIMAVFSMIFVFTYPLLPSQISLISGVTIGIPAFLLALETNSNIIKGHFLANVLSRALSAGLTNFIMIYIIMFFADMYAVPSSEFSIVCALLMSSIGMMFLYLISRPLNVWRSIIWVAMLVSLIFSCVFLGPLFGIAPISSHSAVLLSIFVVASAPVLMIIEIMIKKLFRLTNEKI